MKNWLSGEEGALTRNNSRAKEKRKRKKEMVVHVLVERLAQQRAKIRPVKQWKN